MIPADDLRRLQPERFAKKPRSALAMRLGTQILIEVRTDLFFRRQGSDIMQQGRHEQTLDVLVIQSGGARQLGRNKSSPNLMGHQ